MSVVLDFNASLNADAPVPPMLLTIDVMGMEEWIADECVLCVFFCFHNSD